jgi:hypothetical protein
MLVFFMSIRNTPLIDKVLLRWSRISLLIRDSRYTIGLRCGGIIGLQCYFVLKLKSTYSFELLIKSKIRLLDQIDRLEHIFGKLVLLFQ